MNAKRERLKQIDQERRSAEQPPTGRAFVGCSGWHYDSWVGDFYPAGFKLAHALPFYGSRFRTAEINNSFYRMPSERAVQRWLADSPKDFIFSWKASNYLTHKRLLKNVPVESLNLMLARHRLLGHKAGPILFQVPPRLPCDLGRLRDFLAQLKVATFFDGRPLRYAFEFRNDDWFCVPVLQELADFGIALCISDHADALTPPAVTNPEFTYLRLHGTNGRYAGSYGRAYLQQIAVMLRGACSRGTDVYVYLDNDTACAAPRDCAILEALLWSER